MLACDVLLLYAIDSEYAALQAQCAALGIALSPTTDTRLGEFHDLGMISSSRVFAARTRMGAFRNGGSAHTALMFREVAEPDEIVQVGMAFGTDPSSQQHGDVLISDAVFSYDERAVIERDGEPVTDYARTKARHASRELVRAFRAEANSGRHAFHVHKGTMLSGGARISSARFRSELVSAATGRLGPARAIIGGDMEGVGLLAASPASDPGWCVVKGISDFAEADRDATMREHRDVACANAMRFVLSTLLHRSP